MVRAVWRGKVAETRAAFAKLDERSPFPYKSYSGLLGGSMQAYMDQALEVLRTGFTQINDPKGLIIALVATLFLRSWGQWIPAAVLSTVAYVAIEHFAPVLIGQSELALPPLVEGSFWSRTGILFVGFLVVTGIFFFVKRIIMTALGGGHEASKAKGKH